MMDKTQKEDLEDKYDDYENENVGQKSKNNDLNSNEVNEYK